MAKHNDIGSWGENIACELLITKGYAIVDQNIHIGHYELDIVAMKGSKMVFVEVKTRSSDLTDPVDAIDNKKIRMLCRAAEAYIRQYNVPHEVQFDVVAIIGDPADSSASPVVTHYPDAFRPLLSSK